MEAVIFAEGNTKDFEAAVKNSMENPIKHYEKELVAIRTGRASTALIESIKVECYGQLMKLRELATLTTPEARLIVL